jgi:hypothetical protein
VNPVALDMSFYGLVLFIGVGRARRTPFPAPLPAEQRPMAAGSHR